MLFLFKNILFLHCQGQVFDGGDTSAFKEHPIRQELALNIITCLTINNPQSINLEISEYLQEWIIEEWTFDFDVKPTVQDLKSVEDFKKYAYQIYSKISGLRPQCFKLPD